mgnify:CR=1 FL=1|jgi:hypothetical protein
MHLIQIENMYKYTQYIHQAHIIKDIIQMVIHRLIYNILQFHHY